MSVFAYNPEAAKSWANSVVNFLNGGSDSVSACSKKFSTQMETLVQPNVWTGAAAAQNYQNFLETHQALVNFVNSFGEAFENAMNSVNASVQNLEVSNLGVNTNVGSTFGTLSYEQLTALSEENIKQDVVTYDYNSISTIGGELVNILTTLEDVNNKLSHKIDELDNKSGMWDGNAAAQAKENLKSTLTTNMQKVFETLKICIDNIKAAAEAAQRADSGV